MLAERYELTELLGAGRDGRRPPRQGHRAGARGRREGAAGARRQRVPTGPGSATRCSCWPPLDHPFPRRGARRRRRRGRPAVPGARAGRGPQPGAALPGRAGLRPPALAPVGAELATVLGYVHERGIVHRDIKPGNILIGARRDVMLADFGIARMLGDPTGHTLTGTTVGTAAYLAPEQVRGEHGLPGQRRLLRSAWCCSRRSPADVPTPADRGGRAGPAARRAADPHQPAHRLARAADPDDARRARSTALAVMRRSSRSPSTAYEQPEPDHSPTTEAARPPRRRTGRAVYRPSPESPVPALVRRDR